MKYLITLSIALLIFGCSGKKEEAHGFIEYNGSLLRSNAEGVTALRLKLEEGERSTFKVGASYVSGPRSGKSHAEVLVQRVGNELEVIVNGQGGEEIVWNQRKGQIIECTKTLRDMMTPTTFTFTFSLDKTQPVSGGNG